MNFDRVIYGNLKLSEIIIAVLIFILGLIVAKLLSNYLRRNLKSKLSKDRLEIFIKLVYYFVVILVAIWVMSTLGLKLTGLLYAGGLFGIILGFASQSIVGNLVSGFFLMIERPIKIGNAVNIDGTIGIVEDISLISTRLRTWAGLDIRIPNEKVFTSNITNFVSNVARRFEYVVGIRYEDDADLAILLIKELLEAETFVLANPAPLVFVEKLDESSVNISIKIWAPISEWYSLYMRLLWEIKKKLENNGIIIAFPQRMVWFAEKESEQLPS
jgi:small-conductance mechanosensitive channel